jgi:hypothetical protein
MGESPTPKVPAIRGRPFARGNSGRKRGSVNRTTVILAALLAGEAEALLRGAIKIAQDGNPSMTKFLLDRLLPRERLIKFDLPPMFSADDAVEALGSIMREVSEGRITPSEGAAIAALVDSYSKAIDMADLVNRVNSLEAEVRGVK